MGRFRKTIFILIAVAQALAGPLLFETGCGVVGTPGVPTVPNATTPGGGVPGPVVSSPNPAAPPAPPSEIPLLQLANDLSISTTTTLTANPTVPDLSALVGSGPLADAISFSSILVNFTQLFINDLFAPLSEVVIPVGTGVKNLQFQLTDTQIVFIDFSPIDLTLAKVATNKTCSGNSTVSANHPSCLRLWLDSGEGFKPYLEVIFTEYPREGNPGSGEIRGFADGIFHVTLVYNHVNPADKINEMFFGFVNINSPDPNNPEVGLSIHAFIRQQGEDEARSLKTVNGNNFTGESGFSFGRWLEGSDLWAGTLFTQDDAGNTTNDFSNVCAVISTATEAVPPTACAEAGITSEDLQFLPIGTFRDLDLFDFPLAPP